VGVGGGAIKKRAKAKHRKIKLSSIFIINATITTRPAISNEERGEGALIKTNGKDGKYVERQAEHCGILINFFKCPFQANISQFVSKLMQFIRPVVEQSTQREQPVQLRLSHPLIYRQSNLYK